MLCYFEAFGFDCAQPCTAESKCIKKSRTARKAQAKLKDNTGIRTNGYKWLMRKKEKEKKNRKLEGDFSSLEELNSGAAF